MQIVAGAKTVPTTTFEVWQGPWLRAQCLGFHFLGLRVAS